MPYTNEVQIELSLSEYEASILTGALEGYVDAWDDSEYTADAETASDLRDRVRKQFPEDWE